MKRPREYSSFFLEYIFKIILASIDERFKSHSTLNSWNKLNGYKRIVWKFGYYICSAMDQASGGGLGGPFGPRGAASIGRESLGVHEEGT